MKQYFSIFMMFVRSSIYRVLAVLALMVAAEGVLFYATMHRFLNSMDLGERGYFVLNRLVEDARMGVVFGIAFVLITVLLCRVGHDRRGKLEYTIQRLGVSPVHIFFLQAGCNALFYMLLWLIQVYAAFGFCIWYLQAADASLTTNQTLFLETYRSIFLSSIFPMEDVMGWITNVLVVLLCGVASARVPHAARRGKASFGFFTMLLLMALVFHAGLDTFDMRMTLLICAPLVMGMTIVFVYMTEPGLDEE